MDSPTILWLFLDPSLFLVRNDSEYMFCISMRRFWVDSNPEVVSCRLRCLEIRNFMHELHVAGSVHDDDTGDGLNWSQ